MLIAKIFLAAAPLFIAGLPPTWKGTVPGAITSSHNYPALHAETPGASANCWLYSWKNTSYLARDDSAQITCDITDTSGDSHSVYVKWWQDGYRDVHLTNSKGVGKTVRLSDSRHNSDGSFHYAYWRVCRDIQLGSDNCSSTKKWEFK